MVSLCCVAACNTEECTDNKNSLPYAGFYSASTHSAIAVDSLMVWGIGAPGDSVLLDTDQFIQNIYLPFRLDSDNTAYVVHYRMRALDNDRYNDTIIFKYKSIPYFVSEACGAIYKYEINDINYTRHIIDSVACPNGVIDNKPGENIQIFFRVDEG